jgi:hypothetical protein
MGWWGERRNRRSRYYLHALVVDSKRIFFAGAMAAVPSAFSLFVYVGPLWLVVGYLLGFGLWALLVAPLAIVFRRVDFFFAATICMFAAFVLACWYVKANWVPNVYTSEVGAKILVAKGVATEAYYVDLLTHVLLVFGGLFFGTPLFAFFARATPKLA